MRFLIFFVFLVSCSEVPTARAPFDIPLRNPTAPVASQSDVTLARLSGDWRVVEAAGLSGTRLRIADGAVRMGTVDLPLRDLGGGRLQIGERAVWVHWLDADNRTAALGSPDGTWVWIMDRTGRPGERLRAAREILEWYGYDLSRMSLPTSSEGGAL